MKSIKSVMVRFWADDRGVTAVEYGVLAVLIVAAISAAMTTFSSDLSTAFTKIGTKLTQ